MTLALTAAVIIASTVSAFVTALTAPGVAARDRLGRAVLLLISASELG